MTHDTRPSADLRSERGIALALSLFLLSAMSVLAASLMFLAQTETYATMNYRLMSQARYGGESGVQKTVNYLLNAYPLPGSVDDPLVNYNMTVSPVTYNDLPVLLSAMTGVASNYPVAETVTAFNAAAQGTLAAGSTTVGYAAYATLMSMQPVGASVVQTWQIVSDGTIAGARTGTVEVTSTLETPVIGATGNSYAVFASDPGCGSIIFSSSASTDSYDSASPLVSGKPVLAASGGNVGTNGNLTESGGATVNGKLYTPRTGVGTCNNGGGGVAGDALSQSGSAVVTGGIVQLASTWTPPTPPAPNPLPPTTNQDFAHNSVADCTAISSCSLPNGVPNPNILKFAGGATAATATLLGNVSTSSDVVVHLGAASGCPCYYNINSLLVSGASSIVIDGGPVILTAAGTDFSGASPVLNLSGGGVLNGSFRASDLQINYGGTQPITLSGGTSTAAIVIAPNSVVTISGGGEFYGSIIASMVIDSGGTKIHYDRQLSMFSTQSAGNPLLTAFSWKKY